MEVAVSRQEEMDSKLILTSLKQQIESRIEHSYISYKTYMQGSQSMQFMQYPFKEIIFANLIRSIFKQKLSINGLQPSNLQVNHRLYPSIDQVKMVGKLDDGNAEVIALIVECHPSFKKAEVEEYIEEVLQSRSKSTRILAAIKVKGDPDWQLVYASLEYPNCIIIHLFEPAASAVHRLAHYLHIHLDTSVPTLHDYMYRNGLSVLVMEIDSIFSLKC